MKDESGKLNVRVLTSSGSIRPYPGQSGLIRVNPALSESIRPYLDGFALRFDGLQGEEG
jgi:hypothetical protein